MDEEYFSLQKILLAIIQANKGVPAFEDNRVIDAEGLAVKLFEHSASINYLYKDTVIPEINLRIFDLATLNVIARAIIENFLVFYYVFVEPQNKEEEDFRYMVYCLSGLVERQNYPIESPKGKIILTNEKKVIDNLIYKLEKNSYFIELKNDDKNKLLKWGEWRFKSWSNIALSAGLNESNSKAFYKLLCGYAHSGSLSLQQIHQTASKEEKIKLFNGTLSLLKIAIANMIIAYCNYFPKALAFYIENIELKELVLLWVDVGRKEMKDIEMDWSKLEI